MATGSDYGALTLEQALDFAKWHREEQALASFEGRTVTVDESYHAWLDDLESQRNLAELDRWCEEQAARWDMQMEEPDAAWLELFWSAKIDVADDAATPHTDSLAAAV